MIARKSAVAAAFHSRFGAAFRDDQCLCVLHHVGVGDEWADLFQSFFHLGAEPSVISIWISCQTSGHSAFGCHARKQDADSIR